MKTLSTTVWRAVEHALRAMANRNWHVHSIFSKCAATEMTARNILTVADRLGLQSIALVDHHHPGDPTPLAHILSLKADVASVPHRVAVIVGAELSAYGEGHYSNHGESDGLIEYRLFACNHYHVPGWEHPDIPSPQAYKDHSLAILSALIASGRAACIAHPFLGSYLTSRVDDACSITRALSDEELIDIFQLSRVYGVAWEVNTRLLVHDRDFARRYLAHGFEVGVDFRLGTDAHMLNEIDPLPQVERLIRAIRE